MKPSLAMKKEPNKTRRRTAKPDNSTETDTKKDTAADDVDPADESSRTSSGSGKPTSSKGSTTAGSDPNEPSGGGWVPLGWDADLSELPHGIMTTDQWHKIVQGYDAVEKRITSVVLRMKH